MRHGNNGLLGRYNARGGHSDTILMERLFHTLPENQARPDKGEAPATGLGGQTGFSITRSGNAGDVPLAGQCLPAPVVVYC